MTEFFQYLWLIWFWWLFWIFIKHFLDKDKEKMFFKLSFTREKYLIQKEKCFILLEKIDEVKNKVTLLKITDNQTLEENIDIIKKCWKDMDSIINLIKVYLPELETNTNKYIVLYEKYKLFHQLSKCLYVNWRFDDQSLKKNEKLIETVREFEKKYLDYIKELKENIKNYLIEKEHKFIN